MTRAESSVAPTLVLHVRVEHLANPFLLDTIVFTPSGQSSVDDPSSCTSTRCPVSEWRRLWKALLRGWDREVMAKNVYRTDQVGSLLRPQKLMDARDKHKHGKCTDAE